MLHIDYVNLLKKKTRYCTESAEAVLMSNNKTGLEVNARNKTKHIFLTHEKKN